MAKTPGFTIKFQDVAADAAPANLKSALSDRDVEIALKWSGDVREYIAAMAVSAALVKNFGAIVHDPDGDKVYASEEVLAKPARRPTRSDAAPSSFVRLGKTYVNL